MSKSAVARRRSSIRGRDRKGVRAEDFERQTTDSVAKLIGPSPEYDKPRVMIETMRVEGDDAMTPKDAALYELMLATARNVDIAQEWHVIDLRKAVAFLGDELKEGRVRASLKRLSHTYVSYDFRSEVARAHSSCMPLVLVEIREDLKAGTACIRYSIPEPVREAILGAADYTMLQLNVFPLFRSRYTSRLYQRLAYMSSQPKAADRRWEVEPAKLARILSYPLDEDGSVHVGSLLRRAVEPALADLDSEDVRYIIAFKSQMRDPIRGEGRGRPVEKLVFEVTERTKSFHSLQASRLSSTDINAVRMHDDELLPEEHPGTLLVGRAVTLTGMLGSDLSHEWRAALKRAKVNPSVHVAPGLQGGMLLHVLASGGVEAAFPMWVHASVCVDDDAPVVDATPQAKPAPAFVTDDGDADTMPAMQIAPEPAPAPVATATATADDDDGRPILAALKAKATPELQAARMLEIVQSDAQDILDLIDGWHPGRQFRVRGGVETALHGWCDPYTTPWATLQKLPGHKGHGTVIEAVRLLSRASHEARVHWLGRLAWAIKDADLDRLRRVAGAVIGASRAGQLARAPAPNAHRAENFTATVSVTEMSADRGCADPAYSAGDTSADRDAPEADGIADDCPF